MDSNICKDESAAQKDDLSVASSLNGTKVGTTTVPQAARSIAEPFSRCNALAAEIETFRAYLESKGNEKSVEFSRFRGSVKSERSHFERLAAHAEAASDGNDGHSAIPAEDASSDDDDDSGNVPGAANIACSNLPFLESVWNAAKSSTGLVALQKTYSYGDEVPTKKQGIKAKSGRAIVDVVCRDGLEWIKVSMVSNHRILMDKAREGWGGDDSEDEESDAEDSGDDPDGAIPIVKMSTALIAASKTVRTQTKQPRVRLLLPKVVEGRVPAIDKILRRLRASGMSVECDGDTVRSRPLESSLETMSSPEPVRAFVTDTINIDCTILLALVSDFSHCEVIAEPWFHRALKRQVEIENDSNLLPNTLYPIITARKLVCTAEAAKRMREIVSTIGTPGEKARTAIFMDEASDSGGSRAEQLQRWSRYPVPQDLRLPLEIVDKDSASSEALPAVAARVRQDLTPINQSVFLYGWAAGITTITSNRTVVKQMEATLGEHGESDKDWPKIWLSPTSRSLVGKEKGRK